MFDEVHLRYLKDSKGIRIPLIVLFYGLHYVTGFMSLWNLTIELYIILEYFTLVSMLIIILTQLHYHQHSKIKKLWVQHGCKLYTDSHKIQFTNILLSVQEVMQFHFKNLSKSTKSLDECCEHSNTSQGVEWQGALCCTALQSDPGNQTFLLSAFWGLLGKVSGSDLYS